MCGVWRWLWRRVRRAAPQRANQKGLPRQIRWGPVQRPVCQVDRRACPRHQRDPSVHREMRQALGQAHPVWQEHLPVCQVDRRACPRHQRDPSVHREMRQGSEQAHPETEQSVHLPVCRMQPVWPVSREPVHLPERPTRIRLMYPEQRTRRQ